MTEKKRRIERRRTGTVEWHGDHWDVPPTLADGERGDRLRQPPGMSEAKARDKAAALTELAARPGTTRQRTPSAELAPAASAAQR